MDSPNAKGYGFGPTDEDIIDYLKEKRRDPDFSVHAIPELDIYKFEPWELPGFSATPSKKVRYFYCEPRYKYANSKREHRKTNTGYWKPTGRARDIKADSGEVIGNKRYVPFCSENSAYKKAKTKWVMHEISVVDDPLYKKEFVICRIERKWNKTLGISNSDEGESSKQKQVVSPTQVLSPGDHSISNGNHIDENIVTDPQLPPPNDNVISSYPGNHIERTSLSSHDPLPNHNMVSDPGNRIEQNTFSNTQLPPHYNMLPFPENHFGQDTLSNPQLLPPNHKLISPPGNQMGQNALPDPQLSPPNHNMNSYPGNHILQNSLSIPQLLPLNRNLISSPGNHILHNTISNPPLLPNHNLISYCGNHIEQTTDIQLVPYPNLTSYPTNQIKENSLTNPLGLSNYNMMSFPWNHIEDKTLTGLQLPPNSVSQLVSINTSQEEENHQLEEFNASSGYNGLNYASFSTPQSLNYQEMEFLQLPSNSVSQLVSINTSQEEENRQLQEFNGSSGYNGLNYASFSTPQSPNYQEMEFLQLPPNSVSQLVSKNTSQEENHQFEEFNASSGYNGLNYASFSTPQSPNYQEMELSYSNSSIDNCDFLNFQFDSEQVIDLISSPRAFLDENSLEETGQTHTPDLTLAH